MVSEQTWTNPGPYLCVFPTPCFGAFEDFPNTRSNFSDWRVRDSFFHQFPSIRPQRKRSTGAKCTLPYLLAPCDCDFHYSEKSMRDILIQIEQGLYLSVTMINCVNHCSGTVVNRWPANDIHISDYSFEIPCLKSLFRDTLCSSNVWNNNAWIRQICDRDDRTFGAEMYLLAHAMYSRFELCDYRILLLASEHYLFDAPPSILRDRINLVWNHRGSAALLANFLSAHEELFYDDNPYIRKAKSLKNLSALSSVG